jgi:benzoate membrane transport protein
MPCNLPPLPAWSSALVAALVGFGGTIALVVQAMRVLGASTEQTGSAVTALCLAIAAAGALLSFRLRIPVILAWSTPGAALLAASSTPLPWPSALGVFFSAALLMIATGTVPLLGRLAARIPPSIASAMLAGILLPFCLAIFAKGGADPSLLAALIAIFVAARRRVPLYALLLILAAGIVATLLRGDLAVAPAGPVTGSLLPAMPAFDGAAIVSLAVPLFLVTLVSQNLPGLVVLRAADYDAESRPLIVGTGVASLIAAPFGGHAVNLAAITAAICTGEETHPVHGQRWVVGLLYSGFYLLLALFAPLLVQLFLALPVQVIAILTGLALIPAFVSAAEAMLGGSADRDPALLTFLATASGMSLLGIGSAVWGLLAGFSALLIRRFAGPRPSD